jgi:hypothetical protein
LRGGVPRVHARPLTPLELIASIALWIVALALCAGLIGATAAAGSHR